MTPSAIYSKSGKGVQEASGKTSLLSRGDRAVLSAFDGRLSVSEVADRVGKSFDTKFQQLILQLERDGFVREVSAGTAPGAKRPGMAVRPAPAAAKPASGAAPAGGGGVAGPDLDFTIAIPASPPPKSAVPAAPKVDLAAKARAETEKEAQEDNMARARREAEERAQKERDRVKSEAEAKFRAETEAKLRSEAETKAKSDAEAKLRAEIEAKVNEAEAKIKAAREAAVRAAFEAERKVKEEADRIRREAEEARKKAEEQARKEAEELKRRLEEERKAREEAERARKEAERQAKEEAERARREAEEKARREAEELKRRLEEERKAREEADRARIEAERQAKEEAERAKKEAGERAREEEERSLKEFERAASEAVRTQQELERAQQDAKEQEKPPEPAGKAAGGGFDSLLADLDSFSDRDDADKKAKEDAERKEKDEKKARKAREETEHKAKEEAAEKAEEARKEAEEKARKEERRRKDEEERRAREEEEARAKREAEERRRMEREAAIAKEARAESKSDDIGVTDDDLDLDDVKRDQQAVSKESRKAAREREREARERELEARERAKEREREAKRAAKGGTAPVPAAYKPFRRKRSWGKPIALTLFILLVAAAGAIHVMPVSTADYEKAASEAIGRPVKIGVAHLSLYSGIVLKLDGVSIGDVKVATVLAFPEVGSLFDEKKAFTRIELQGVSLPQEALGEVLTATIKGARFSVARLSARQLKLTGPLSLPVIDADMAITRSGSVGVISVQGPDSLVGKLTPNGSEIEFDVTASGFTLPFLPEVTLSTFAMKGRANRNSARIESWGGASLDGAISGTANVRWGANWTIDGTLTARGINAAVFAPALLSEGKAEGTGRFSLNDPDPTNFKGRGRVEGTFSLNKGVLGSFDLSRAILTGGRQATGRTPFTEMNGQAVFDKGAVALRNVTFGAGAMNAGASADITPEGALSGRIVADIRTSSQNLRATVNVGGTVKEPQVK